MLLFYRIGFGLITLILILSLTFISMKAVPGGPFDFERPIPEEVRIALVKHYSLDQPVYKQFMSFLKNSLKLDFGYSYRYQGSRSVREIITESLKLSATLGLFALFFSVCSGVLIGVISAAFYRRKLDHLFIFIINMSSSIPNFVIACCLVWIFSVWLEWLPVAFLDSWQSAILPILTLSFRPFSLVSRLTRASMIEVLASDFIRTAYAKGLSSFKVLFKHGLKNVMVPITASIASLASSLMTGSLVVETMFAIPGLGQHFVSSVLDRDYPMIMGTTALLAVVIIGIQIIADMCKYWIDPRLRNHRRHI